MNYVNHCSILGLYHQNCFPPLRATTLEHFHIYSHYKIKTDSRFLPDHLQRIRFHFIVQCT